MNPYSFLDPVTEPKMFYGYHAELERIVNKVAAPGRERQSFFVAGAGQMGKTSLLLQAERRLRLLGPERVVSSYQQLLIPLYVDMLRPMAATYQGFFDIVARRLSEYLTTESFSFALPPQMITTLQSLTVASEPLEGFTSCLRELVQAIRPMQLRVVLLIDDLLRIVDKDKDGLINLTLRALHTTPSIENVVAYVITGSYQEHEPVRSPGSPLENILLLNYLHAFSKEQSMAFINEPTGGVVPTEVAEQIYLESGGHPFLLQYLMYMLCEQEDFAGLKIDDIFQATVRFSSERRNIEKWWDKLRDIDRKIYEVFCEGEQITADNLARMMLSVPSPTGDRRQRVADREMINDSLRALSTTGLIRELPTGSYELAGQWPARWFRENT